MNGLGNTLVMGGGAAGLSFAAFLKSLGDSKVGLWLRDSQRGKNKIREIRENHSTVRLRTKQANLKEYEGGCRFDQISSNMSEFKNYETVVICLPACAYVDVIPLLSGWDELSKVKQMILVAAPLGANALVKKSLGPVANEIDILSLSSFIAAVKFGASATELIIKGKKRRIYISRPKNPALTSSLTRLLASWEIDIVWLERAIEVEARNINIYVHPPFVINRRVLDRIYLHQEHPVYLYRFEPEGPLSLTAFRTMLNLYNESTDILDRFGAKTFNLLAFLNDDNYSLPESYLSRHDIDSFPKQSFEGRLALLMARYGGLLVDPYSEPDAKSGEYFPFSKVSIPVAYALDDGEYQLPRSPVEEYLLLQTLMLLSRACSTDAKTLHELAERVEQYTVEFEQARKVRLTPSLSQIKSFARNLADATIDAHL